MIPKVEHKDWSYFAADVSNLCNEVQIYLSELKAQLGINHDQDVRFIMLNAMQHEYVSSLWLIACIMVVTKNPQRIEEFYKQVDQKGDKTKIERVITDFARKSIVTRIHFLLDHFLSCFSEYLDGSSKRSVCENAEKIKDRLSLDKKDIDVFSALRHTRNAFHNNGKHNKKNCEFTIEGRTFSFTQGQEISLSWDDIKTLTHKTIRIAICWGKSVPSNTLIKNL